MSSDVVKLSGLTKTTKPLNPSDLIFTSTTGQSGYGSYTMSVDDLQKVISKDLAYTTVAAGLAATAVNGIFYVYTDSTQHFVYGYTDKGTAAEQILDTSGNPKVYITGSYFSQLATNYGYSLINEVVSFAALRLLPVTTEGQKVKLRSWNLGGTKGGGEFIGHIGTTDSTGTAIIDDGGVTALGSGFYWSRVNEGELRPEDFGCVGDGVTDDAAGMQALCNALQHNQKIYSVKGNGNYAMSTTVNLANLGFSLNFYLRSLCPTASWVAPANWKNAQPLFTIGGAGSMVSLNFRVDYFNGNGVADWLHVIGQGCGGSYFHCQRMTNVVNGIRSVGVTWSTASNYVTGGYWDTGKGIGVWIERPTTGTSGVVEGWNVNVNFIASFNICAILVRNGAQYANIWGQSDFNGRYCSVITYTTSSTVTPTRNDTLTAAGGLTGEMIAYYNKTDVVLAMLVYEGADVSSNGSKFTVGGTLTSSDGNFVATIVSIQQPSVDNWYPDIVMDFAGSAFSKCFIYSAYCGGVIGDSLFSSEVYYNNSSTSTTKASNGAQWVNSGQAMSLRNTYFDKYVLDFYKNFMAPYQHLYMRNFRIYGIEVGASLPKNSGVDVFQFSYAGDGTVAGAQEVWRVTQSSNWDSVIGECLVGVNSSGAIYIVNSSVSYISFSVDSTATSNLVAVQGAQDNMLSVFNFQRII